MNHETFTPYKEAPSRRYKMTLAFMHKHLAGNESLLDLGIVNPFTQQLQSAGYTVTNTGGEDLDVEWSRVKENNYDVLTAFEILEHLVNPFMLLKEASASKLVATVPMDQWFGKTYRNGKDKRDWHYHEFLDWQFDMLLEKAGWTIIDREKWTNPRPKLGFRPILRYFVPRYYAVYAERK